METMEHLLNSCTSRNFLWQNHEILFGHYDRDYSSTKITMENWMKKICKSPILNQACNISLGFLLWVVWKERNQRVFKDEKKYDSGSMEDYQTKYP